MSPDLEYSIYIYRLSICVSGVSAVIQLVLVGPYSTLSDGFRTETEAERGPKKLDRAAAQVVS